MAATNPRWVGAVRRSPSFFSLSWNARGVGASRRGDHKEPICTGKRFTDARLANEIGRALVGLPEFDRVAFGIVDPREPANTRRIPFWIGCDLDSLALESRLQLVEPFDTEVQHPLLGRREIVSVCVERGKTVRRACWSHDPCSPPPTPTPRCSAYQAASALGSR